MFHRHPNGRGLVTQQSDVSEQTFLDYDSLTSGDCAVDSGHISRSVVTGISIVSNSTIINSDIDCNRITNSFVLDSKLGKRVVVRNSHIESSSLTGAILVEGKLSNVTIEHWHNDYLRLHGEWNRVPRFLSLEKFTLSECHVINGVQQIHIGCSCKPVTYWLNLHSRVRMGKRLGADSTIITEFIHSLTRDNQNYQHQKTPQSQTLSQTLL